MHACDRCEIPNFYFARSSAGVNGVTSRSLRPLEEIALGAAGGRVTAAAEKLALVVRPRLPYLRAHHDWTETVMRRIPMNQARKTMLPEIECKNH